MFTLFRKSAEMSYHYICVFLFLRNKLNKKTFFVLWSQSIFFVVVFVVCYLHVVFVVCYLHVVFVVCYLHVVFKKCFFVQFIVVFIYYCKQWWSIIQLSKINSFVSDEFFQSTVETTRSWSHLTFRFRLMASHMEKTGLTHILYIWLFVITDFYFFFL
jgi:hypothetical protein